MEKDTHLEGRKAPRELASERLDIPGFDGPVDPDTVARSDTNILRWREYLPEDCVQKMIEMQWDLTT